MYPSESSILNFDDECDGHTRGMQTGRCDWFKESYSCYDDLWTECSTEPVLPSNTVEIDKEECKCSDGTITDNCRE